LSEWLDKVLSLKTAIKDFCRSVAKRSKKRVVDTDILLDFTIAHEVKYITSHYGAERLTAIQISHTNVLNKAEGGITGLQETFPAKDQLGAVKGYGWNVVYNGRNHEDSMRNAGKYCTPRKQWPFLKPPRFLCFLRKRYEAPPTPCANSRLLMASKAHECSKLGSVGL
jgi:hypothetical protein